MLREENVSIKITGEERLKTELTNKRLYYSGKIEVDFSELDFPISECSLRVEFFGWDLFKAQEFEFEAENDEADKTARLTIDPIELQDEKPFTLKSDEPLQISAFLKHERSNTECRENKIVTYMSPAGLSVGISSVYSVVFQQNQFSLINTLEVSNQSGKAFGLTKVIT